MFTRASLYLSNAIVQNVYISTCTNQSNQMIPIPRLLTVVVIDLVIIKRRSLLKTECSAYQIVSIPRA